MAEGYIPAAETLFGVSYPNHHLVAMAEDQAEADRTIKELRAAGFDATAYPGDEVIRRHDAYLEHRTLAEKISTLIPSEEEETMREHLRRAAEGEVLLLVPVASDEEAARAVALLKLHEAGAITRYEDWVWTTY